jgi:PAS domain S-box-containing protein
MRYLVSARVVVSSELVGRFSIPLLILTILFSFGLGAFASPATAQPSGNVLTLRHPANPDLLQSVANFKAEARNRSSPATNFQTGNLDSASLRDSGYEETVLESLRRHIRVCIFIFLMLALLIAGLLRQSAKKAKAERYLLDRLAFERLVYDLSNALTNLPEHQLDLTIAKSLERIAVHLKVDQIVVREIAQGDHALEETHSWRAEGTALGPAVAAARQFPWLSQRLARGQSTFLSDVGALPKDAFAEREYLQKLGAVSTAVVPLQEGGEILGCLSFFTIKAAIFWTEDSMDRAKMVANIFSNALVRKRAQSAKLRYAAMVESSDDAIVSEDVNGIVLSWNMAAQHIFGYSDTEMVGKSMCGLIPLEHGAEEENLRARLQAGKSLKHFETVRQRKSGELIDVSFTISPMKDYSGKVTGFSTIARDITERKKAELALQESEARFRVAANLAPVLIWMSGTDKLCTFFNQSWLNFTGRSIEELLGEGWAADVHREDLIRCMNTYVAAFNARQSFEMEYRLRRHDGEYRWVVDQGAPRYESDGSFRGYIGACVDITDRKLTEDAQKDFSGRLIVAQEAERNRIARELHDEFSQRMALLGIGLGRIWAKFPESENEQRPLVGKLMEQANQISSDLRRLSHELHSTKLEYVGLVPAIGELCGMMSEKYGIQVGYTVSGDLPEIPKDVALCLFRIAQEALNNVAKHSKAQEASIELWAVNNKIRLRILDAGAGFDPDVLSIAKGIGLIGMRERLRLAGGILSVRSAPMCGTEIIAEVQVPTSAKVKRATVEAVGG